jgi:hypothetical protein
MKLYHASTVKIESFHIPYGGLHFGGIYSAIIAALRHYYSNDLSTEILHIHCCEVDINNPVLVDDQGSAEQWENEFKSVRGDALEYNNKFEPDTENSFCIFDAGKVLKIEHSTMHIDVAEDMLDKFETYSDDYYFKTFS